MVAPADSTVAAYDSKVEGNIIFTKMDAAINWMRKNSMWPMPMGLACCAIEMMAAACSRYDLSRFGAEVMRFSPRQADVMIVAGTVTYKMALAVKRVWDQMPEPKWCIAMGACASSGGMYRSYAVLQGIDNLIPVDVYISGCPPRPEALLEGMMRLQHKIETEHSFTEQKKELLEELTKEGHWSQGGGARAHLKSRPDGHPMPLQGRKTKGEHIGVGVGEPTVGHTRYMAAPKMKAARGPPNDAARNRGTERKMGREVE